MKLRFNEKVHGYFLDGRRIKAVTTVAKVPEDGYALDQWRKRMVAIGVAYNPDLAAQVKLADSEGDKDLLNECAEEAMTRAGAHLAAEAGTKAHATSEAHDRGEEHDDAFTAARWQMMLDAAGFDIDPEMIERMVVYPDEKIAGRFDRLPIRRTDGCHVLADLKTGASAVRYPHSTIIQLALYANAPVLSGELAVIAEDEEGNKTWQTEDFTSLPEDLDRETGYVLYMPEGGELEVWAANLKLGWKCVQDICLPTLRWRAIPHERLIKRVA